MGPARIIFAAIALIASTAQAGLKWEQQEIELKPKITDTEGTAHFKYENTGDQTVKITGVQSSCGCTAATAGKNEVGPGEKGEITATFKFGDRVGMQTKTVNVSTDDPSAPTTTLTLKANVPRLLEINPTFVMWRTDEAKGPKAIDIKISPESPIKDLKVSSSSPAFAAKIEKGSDPKLFRLVVEPVQTNQMTTATITVIPDLPADPPKVYYVSARVLPSAPPRPAPAASAPAAPSSGY